MCSFLLLAQKKEPSVGMPMAKEKGSQIDPAAHKAISARRFDRPTHNILQTN